MTLASELQRIIAQLTMPLMREQLIEVDCQGQQAACELVAADSLACAFKRLIVRDPALVGQSVDELKKTASRLSAKLTYLLEPISPIETDAQGCVVQMRSNPPHKDTDRTSYYELLVARSGELSLCRYLRTAGGTQRDLIAAQVTHEVLSRLVSDLAMASSGG